MKTLFLTNEYPPNIYGGAGVHVGYLSRELAKTIPVEVRCFGNQRLEEGNLKVIGFELDTSNFTCPKPLRSAFGAVRRCTDFNTMNIDSDLVHCHTWYSHFGGILAKKNYGLPLVITVHSLEPLRPWKREQLAGGYEFSLWVEKTALEMADAIIAVSGATKHDIERLFNVDPARVHVIHNGIDLNQYRKVDSTGALNVTVSIRPSHICFLWGGSRARKGFSIWCAQSNSWIAISRSCCVQPRQTRRNWARKCGLLSNAQKRSGRESSGSMKWSINRPRVNFTLRLRYSFVRRSTNRLASLI